MDITNHIPADLATLILESRAAEQAKQENDRVYAEKRTAPRRKAWEDSVDRAIEARDRLNQRLHNYLRTGI